MVSWNCPKFGNDELHYVSEALKSGYASEGVYTKTLEDSLAKILEVKHVIMTTSCTAALYLAIEADKRIRGYTSGKVIVPSVGFVALKNAIELAGLTCVYFDVNRDFMLDEEEIELEKVNPKIVIPVNLLGRSIDFPEGDYTLIYDNAGCVGSIVPNGKVGCYSLQANKMINAGGQGGFCVTDDEEYAKMIRKLKDFGREDKYDNTSDGFNFKFNDIQAAVALGQLSKLNEIRLTHDSQYEKYVYELDSFCAFFHYDLVDEHPLWVEILTSKRDKLFDYLKYHGIEARKPWKPLADMPNSSYYCNNCLWLPGGQQLTEIEQTFVISKIKDFFTGK